MDQESQDAVKLEQALEAISKGRFDSAHRMLAEVASHAPAPEQYVYQFEAGDALVIKFWDVTEFTHYVTIHRDTITQKLLWQTSVYPRAYYYLGLLAVKKQRYQEGLDLLDIGERMEPNPYFQLEKAQAYIRGFQDYDRALECYEKILSQGEEVNGSLRAAALRGTGFLLIEAEELDVAEECFSASLRLDPENEVALNELQYIARLRAGGPEAPMKAIMTQGKAMVCEICGREVGDNAQVVNDQGRLVYLCERCQTGQPRKWWQFWR